MREAVFSFLKKMTENKFRRTPKNNAGFVIHQAASQRGKSGAGFFEGPQQMVALNVMEFHTAVLNC